jgi:hypothetical protein
VVAVPLKPRVQLGVAVLLTQVNKGAVTRGSNHQHIPCVHEHSICPGAHQGGRQQLRAPELAVADDKVDKGVRGYAGCVMGWLRVGGVMGGKGQESKV